MAEKLRESYSGLEEIVRERTKELQSRTESLARLNKVMVNRELAMMEIKNELEKCKKQH